VRWLKASLSAWMSSIRHLACLIIIICSCFYKGSLFFRCNWFERPINEICGWHKQETILTIHYKRSLVWDLCWIPTKGKCSEQVVRTIWIGFFPKLKSNIPKQTCHHLMETSGKLPRKMLTSGYCAYMKQINYLHVVDSTQYAVRVDNPVCFSNSKVFKMG
jgi:hypothetical protein